MLGRLFATLTVLLTAMPCRAGVHVSLPLQGYYHPGRYLPVAVWTDNDPPQMQTLTIAANGAATTVVDCQLTSRPRIVPLLAMTASVSSITVSVSGKIYTVDQPLHPLEANEHLVVVSGADAALAYVVYGRDRTIVVQLDPREAMQDSPIAMQTLDAMVIDGPWPGGRWVENLPTILGGGTAVVIAADARPDTTLPWEPLAGGWILRPQLLGPTGCDAGEDAYAPTHAWHPDLPVPMRERVVLVGVLIALGVGACLLLPGRWRGIAVASGAVLSSAAILVWARTIPSVYAAGGSIVCETGTWEQHDRWRYLTSTADQMVSAGSEGMTWPIFTDSSQLLRSHATLRLSEGRWTWQLNCGEKLALLTRQVSPRANLPNAVSERTQESPSSVASPLAGLLRPVYGANDASVKSESVAADEWPTIEALR